MAISTATPKTVRVRVARTRSESGVYLPDGTNISSYVLEMRIEHGANNLPMVWLRMLAGTAMLLMSALPARSADDAPPAPPWESPLARESPLTGQIREPRSGHALTPDALIDRLASADFVILGERHDNSDHHRLQAWIYNRGEEERRRQEEEWEARRKANPGVPMRRLKVRIEDQYGKLKRHNV